MLAVLLLITLTLLAKPAKVIRVVDGDTFVIETGERVRVIGINAPEMKTEYGEPAKEHLLALIDGKTVDLQPDHISADKDVYGRLLRYVYLDGVDINKKMVTDGYAIAFLKYPFDKEAEYKQEETNAKTASLGIWQNNNGNNNGALHGTGIPLTAVLVISGIIIVLIGMTFLRTRKTIARK